jgi:pilus assembly protein CpaB
MNPLRMLFLHISRTPPAVMLMLIVGLAVLVAFGVQDTLNKQNVANQAEQDKLKAKLNDKSTVVYATKDIPEGQPVPSEALEERSIPADRVPMDAVTSAALASGRVAKYGITSGQIVSLHDLAAQAMETSFDTRLRAGMRAVTFAVDTNSGVAGFVMPQSRVDIMCMVGSGGDTKAAPILSDVQVIAVGQTFQKGANGANIPSSSVTVAVSPEETQKLIKAVAASKLYLALRNDKDHTPLATVDVNSLFAKSVPQPAISYLPPPPQLPNAPQVSDLPPPPVMGDSNEAAKVPMPRNHNIDSWAGGKKDVITIPANQ